MISYIIRLLIVNFEIVKLYWIQTLSSYGYFIDKSKTQSAQSTYNWDQSKLDVIAALKNRGTPFKWMLQLEEELDISCPVLRELISRWSVHNNCFRIKQHLVSFTVVDVCFALGLWVVGEQLHLKDDGGWLVNEVFGGEEIKIDILLEKLVGKVYKKMLMNYVSCTYFFYYMFFIFPRLLEVLFISF